MNSNDHFYMTDALRNGLRVMGANKMRFFISFDEVVAYIK